MQRSWFLSLFLVVAMTTPAIGRADVWAPVGRVVSASYGVYGHYVDVTGIVRRYVLPAAEMDVENKTFGFDPYKGETKYLNLVIDTPRGRFQRVYEEGDTIRFWGY
ncbi:MAG: hypothetical protein WAK31_24555 [Chthoniobacterales bacterium]